MVYLCLRYFQFLKNKRGNRCNSDKHRQIAISSIVDKLLDIIVLEEQEDILFTDVLQFLCFFFVFFFYCNVHIHAVTNYRALFKIIRFVFYYC